MPSWFGGGKRAFGSPLRSPRRLGHSQKKLGNSSTRKLSVEPAAVLLASQRLSSSSSNNNIDDTDSPNMMQQPQEASSSQRRLRSEAHSRRRSMEMNAGHRRRSMNRSGSAAATASSSRRRSYAAGGGRRSRSTGHIAPPSPEDLLREEAVPNKQQQVDHQISSSSTKGGTRGRTTDDDDDRALYKRIRSALKQGASLQVIQDLVHENPRVLTMTNDNGWLLLHFCCYFQPTRVDLTRYLVQQHPKSTWQLADETQVTPLHLACFRGAPLAVVKGLCRSGNALLQQENVDGWTPFYFACCASGPMDVIEYLHEQYPLACLLVNRQGNTLLRVLQDRYNNNRTQQSSMDDHHDDRIRLYVSHVTANGACAVLNVAAISLTNHSAMRIPEEVLQHLSKIRKSIPPKYNSQPAAITRNWLAGTTAGQLCLFDLLGNEDFQTMLEESSEIQKLLCRQIHLLFPLEDDTSESSSTSYHE